MAEIEIYSPRAKTRTSNRPLADRIKILQGKRIGFLNNMKANAESLLHQLTLELTAHNGVFSVEIAEKNPTTAAPDDVIAHLSSCDAVVLAIAD